VKVTQRAHRLAWFLTWCVEGVRPYFCTIWQVPNHSFVCFKDLAGGVAKGEGRRLNAEGCHIAGLRPFGSALPAPSARDMVLKAALKGGTPIGDATLRRGGRGRNLRVRRSLTPPLIRNPSGGRDQNQGRRQKDTKRLKAELQTEMRRCFGGAGLKPLCSLRSLGVHSRQFAVTDSSLRVQR